MHPARLSLGSWEQETQAIASTSRYKAMGRTSLGGQEQQEQGKGANFPGWWTSRQTGFPVQCTSVKKSRCDLCFWSQSA